MAKHWIHGVFLVLLYCLAVNAQAFSVGKKAVLKVYDGDSLNIKTRLAHIDAPEINGKCDKEITLAKQARDFTQAFMRAYPKYKVQVVGTGHYGRPLVEIRANGQYLNQLLVDSGLARIYEGGRKSWCL